MSAMTLAGVTSERNRSIRTLRSAGSVKTVFAFIGAYRPER